MKIIKIFLLLLSIMLLSGCANSNLANAELGVENAELCMKNVELNLEASNLTFISKTDKKYYMENSNIMMETACETVSIASFFLNKITKKNLSEKEQLKYKNIEEKIKNIKKKITIDCTKVHN